MNILKKKLYKVAIKYLLDRFGKGTIPQAPISLAQENDDIFIRVYDLDEKKDQEQEISYLIDRLDEDSVHCFYFTEYKKDPETGERPIAEVTLSLDDLEKHPIQVQHYYKHFTHGYSGLLRGFFRILFQKHRFHIWKIKLLRRKVNPEYDRMDLLQDLVKLRGTDFHNMNEVGFNRLTEHLHGPYFNHAEPDDHSRATDSLNFLLDSLAHTGDISREQNSFYGKVKVMPKALNTLYEYDQDRTRHNTMITLAVAQIILGLGLLIVAVVEVVSIAVK